MNTIVDSRQDAVLQTSLLHIHPQVDLFDKAHEAASIQETVEPPLSLQVATQAECCTSSDELPPSLYRYLNILAQQLVSTDRQLRLVSVLCLSTGNLCFLLKYYYLVSYTYLLETYAFC